MAFLRLFGAGFYTETAIPSRSVNNGNFKCVKMFWPVCNRVKELPPCKQFDDLTVTFFPLAICFTYCILCCDWPHCLGFTW